MVFFALGLGCQIDQNASSNLIRHPRSLKLLKPCIKVKHVQIWFLVNITSCSYSTHTVHASHVLSTVNPKITLFFLHSMWSVTKTGCILFPTSRDSLTNSSLLTRTPIRTVVRSMRFQFSSNMVRFCLMFRTWSSDYLINWTVSKNYQFVWFFQIFICKLYCFWTFINYI